jgi:hypothetical protein
VWYRWLPVNNTSINEVVDEIKAEDFRIFSKMMKWKTDPGFIDIQLLLIGEEQIQMYATCYLWDALFSEYRERLPPTHRME